MRKALINIVKGACSEYGIKYRGNEVTEEMLLTYLEKQKEQKPAEWSEEDEKVWQDIFDLCNRFGYDDACRKLKSLRPPQYCENCKLKRSVENWKPSEAQMRALNEIICLGEISYVGQEEELIALRNKLKKLM